MRGNGAIANSDTGECTERTERRAQALLVRAQQTQHIAIVGERTAHERDHAATGAGITRGERAREELVLLQFLEQHALALAAEQHEMLRDVLRGIDVAPVRIQMHALLARHDAGLRRAADFRFHAELLQRLRRVVRERLARGGLRVVEHDQHGLAVLAPRLEKLPHQIRARQIHRRQFAHRGSE